MRSPEQVLKALNKHGKVSDYKFERLYRILFNEEIFMLLTSVFTPNQAI